MDEEHEIDPGWWAPALDGHEEREAPEMFSFGVRDIILREPDMPEFQRIVLEAIFVATNARLSNETQQQPFTPMFSSADSRSALPEDLDERRTHLLARVAPLVNEPAIRARLADVAWFCGDRSRSDLLDIAIGAYTETAPDSDAWYSSGADGWQRAFNLSRYRGKPGRPKVDAMIDQLKKQLLASTSSDRFRLGDWSQMLRKNARLDDADARMIGEHLVLVAATESIDPRLSRHLEREAANWFGEANKDSALGCLERAARTYVAEADLRLAGDVNGGTMVEGWFIEKAIAAFRKLPRSYRLENGIEDDIRDLRQRLVDSRESASELMLRIESDPIDLSRVAVESRERVSGKEKWEALAMFASLVGTAGYDDLYESTQNVVANSVSSLFGSSIYTADGRKVSSRDGVSGGPNDPAILGQMVQTIRFQCNAMCTGSILPALEVITREHHYSRDWMIAMCMESPAVPDGHAGLWGAGLALGLGYQFGLATAILAPQIEQVVRTSFKRRGIHTLVVDDATGVESEKGLGALLDMPEAVEVFGAGQVFELKAVLTDSSGGNVRNDVAHGLYNDVAAQSYDAIFTWWMSLRMVVWPLWRMSQTPPSGDQ